MLGEGKTRAVWEERVYMLPWPVCSDQIQPAGRCVTVELQEGKPFNMTFKAPLHLCPCGRNEFMPALWVSMPAGGGGLCLVWCIV